MPIGTHSQFIRHSLHLAEIAGADPIVLERELGAELREAGENGWVSSEVCYRKIRLLKDLLKTDSPPFLMAKNFSMSAFGVAGYVILNSPNGEIAFRKYAEYQQLTSNLCVHEVHRNEEGLSLQLSFSEEWRDELKFIVEFTFLGFLNQVSAAIGRMVHPLRATFIYPEPKEISKYQEAFAETELLFNQSSNSLLYPGWVAEGKLITANPSVFSMFDELASEALAASKSREKFGERVRSILVNEIRGGLPPISFVADRLNISARSLQQKLSAENTSYREIADEVRRDLAVVHLKKRMLNFSEIAYLLGFSEVSAFSNAFKKWTGHAPSVYAGQVV